MRSVFVALTGLALALLLWQPTASANPRVVGIGKCLADGTTKRILSRQDMWITASCDLSAGAEIMVTLISRQSNASNSEVLSSLDGVVDTPHDLDTLRPNSGDCDSISHSLDHVQQDPVGPNFGFFGHYEWLFGCAELKPDCDCYVAGRVRVIRFNP